MQLAAFLSLAAELSHMRHLHPSPASEASAGRCIGDLRSPFLSKQDADALHRLCAKQRSGGGGRFVENLLTRELFLKTPTLAFALLRPSLPARGGTRKGRDAMTLESPLLSAIPGLHHAFFSREGGVSEGIYAGLNGGIRSQDDPAHVMENRRRMAAALRGPPERCL